MKSTSSILLINKETIKNKKYLKLCRKTIYIMMFTLCQNMPFREAIEIVSKYYKIKKKVVQKFLKFTIFDQDIVIILKNEKGKEFLSHCKYLYVLYKAINKIIYNMFNKNKKIKLILYIQAIGEYWSEYDNAGKILIIRAINWELKKKKGKYKDFYEKYLDKKFLNYFNEIHFNSRVEKIFKKFDTI